MPFFKGSDLAIIIKLFKTIILLIVFVLIEWLGREQNHALATLGIKWNRILRYGFYYSIIVAIFLFGGKEQQFVYFQF